MYVMSDNYESYQLIMKENDYEYKNEVNIYFFMM